MQFAHHKCYQPAAILQAYANYSHGGLFTVPADVIARLSSVLGCAHGHGEDAGPHGPCHSVSWHLCTLTAHTGSARFSAPSPHWHLSGLIPYLNLLDAHGFDKYRQYGSAQICRQSISCLTSFVGIQRMMFMWLYTAPADDFSTDTMCIRPVSDTYLTFLLFVVSGVGCVITNIILGE